MFCRNLLLIDFSSFFNYRDTCCSGEACSFLWINSFASFFIHLSWSIIRLYLRY